MSLNDLAGFGLFIAYFVVVGLPVLLLRAYFKLPSELVRKLYHIVITLSIFPLVEFFDTWYAAMLAAISFALIIYPLLALVEKTSLFKRIAVEREGGEFKKSLLIVQLTIAILILIFWGILGEDWRYIIVVAMMAWGFGDAAAALVGKAIGRRKIIHQQITCTKTVEGTHSMFAVSGLAAFLVLQFYAGQPLHLSLWVSLIIAAVCSVVELFSGKGMDTFTVPLSAGVITMGLITLFSLFGG